MLNDLIEYESGEPICPECGEEAEWVDCEECGGNATIECICEGMGGELKCSVNCEDKLDAGGYDL